MENKQQSKDTIQNIIDTKYQGSLRFLREKNTISLFGRKTFDEIKSTIDEKLHNPTSLLLYCFLNDILEHPKCICGNDVKFDTTRKLFATFCCPECRYTNFESTVEKRTKTNMEKYGSGTYMSSKEGLERTKQVCLEKYGVDNYSKTEEFKKMRKSLIKS